MALGDTVEFVACEMEGEAQAPEAKRNKPKPVSLFILLIRF